MISVYVLLHQLFEQKRRQISGICAENITFAQLVERCQSNGEPQCAVSFDELMFAVEADVRKTLNDLYSRGYISAERDPDGRQYVYPLKTI